MIKNKDKNVYRYEVKLKKKVYLLVKKCIFKLEYKGTFDF